MCSRSADVMNATAGGDLEVMHRHTAHTIDTQGLLGEEVRF